MDDLVTCPHCNGSGKVPSSEALRVEADTLIREGLNQARSARSGREARAAARQLDETIRRVREIMDEIQRRADRALGMA